MSDKAALRRELRARFAGEAARAEESRLICGHILQSDVYRQARIVGGYMPLRHEADVTKVLLDALSSGKTLALPLCGKPPHMTLRQVSSLEELLPGAYGIPEPAEDSEIIPADALDLLLVPLEGIGPDGMRLGKGGGYYDCLLAGTDVLTMGCALSWQRAERIPAQAWDRPLRACATCEGVQLYGQPGRVSGAETLDKRGSENAEKEESGSH